MVNDSKTIVYKISPDGQSVEVTAEGFHGSGCIDFAKKAMAAVGETQELKKRPEFFEEAHVHNRI